LKIRQYIYLLLVAGTLLSCSSSYHSGGKTSVNGNKKTSRKALKNSFTTKSSKRKHASSKDVFTHSKKRKTHSTKSTFSVQGRNTKKGEYGSSFSSKKKKSTSKVDVSCGRHRAKKGAKYKGEKRDSFRSKKGQKEILLGLKKDRVILISKKEVLFLPNKKRRMDTKNPIRFQLRGSLLDQRKKKTPFRLKEEINRITKNLTLSNKKEDQNMEGKECLAILLCPRERKKLIKEAISNYLLERRKKEKHQKKKTPLKEKNTKQKLEKEISRGKFSANEQNGRKEKRRKKTRLAILQAKKETTKKLLKRVYFQKEFSQISKENYLASSPSTGFTG